MSAARALLPRARRLVAAAALAVVAAPVASAVVPAPAHAAVYGQLIVDEAARHYGAPYVYGATGPNVFDCSGFTGFVYRRFGLVLPRTAAQQYDALPHIAQDRKQPGDLIFFYNNSGIYHVGVYAGGNTFWAATHTGDVVRAGNIWTGSYLVARPVLGGAIGQHWQDLGGSASVLGQAVDLEHGVPGGRATDFRTGLISWSPRTGAHEVHGAIAGLYGRTGGAGGVLGLPVTDEYGAGRARVSRFQHGVLRWNAATNTVVRR